MTISTAPLTHPSTAALPALSEETLLPLVRGALDAPEASIVEWHGRVIYTPIQATTGGVYRVQGLARVLPSAPETPWSLILKIVRVPPAPAPSMSSIDRGQWDREVLAYESSLLQHLPGGLTAPGCYAIHRRADTVWLWLEDIADVIPHPWPMARYAAIARTLGAFNGAYAAGHPLPEYPWLHPPFLRWRAGKSPDALRQLQGIRDHPLVRRGWPGDLAERTLAVAEHAPPLVAALDRVPQVLQHADGDPRNLLVRPRGAAEQIVGIDWGSMGIGPLGDDLAAFVLQSATWFSDTDIDLTQLASFAALMEEAYIDGLHDAGWRGDHRHVRFAVAAALTLRSVFRGVFEIMAQEPAGRARFEAIVGRPTEEMLDTLAPIRRFTVEQAEKAFALLPTLN
jgi:hypothetical protein